MVRVLLGRMEEREPWWAELWSAVAAILWCSVAALLTEGLDVLTAFRVVTAFAPAWVWYVFGTVLPLCQVWALRRDERHVRWWLALVMCAYWTFLAIAVWQAAHPTPGLVFYPVCAAINFYTVWRLRTD